MELQLLGSWSGEVLARMKAHYQATVAARRAFAEFNDPVNVQKRRDEAKHQRQNLHAIRLERKKECDRIWRASIQTVDP
jgi:phage-related protein